MAKRQAAKPADLIDVGQAPTTEDEQQALATTGGGLTAFIDGIGQFLTRSRALEAKAGALERTAATLKAPATAAQDAELQRFIQTSRACSKEIAGHWSITSQVSQFHKMLVGYRERAGGKAERAGAVAQRLHNAYVQAEQRRVAEENERRRVEAENRARLEREREAQELEQRALDREAEIAELSDRERRFVELFVAGRTTLDAARQAGYRQPERFKLTDKIQRAIFAAKEAAAARQQAAAVQERPLDVEPIEEAAANVTKIGSDRKTRSAEILDERLLIEAVIGGKYGIPADVLSVNPAKLNEYARSLEKLINRWPGVRYVEKTTTV